MSAPENQGQIDQTSLQMLVNGASVADVEMADGGLTQPDAPNDIKMESNFEVHRTATCQTQELNPTNTAYYQASLDASPTSPTALSTPIPHPYQPAPDSIPSSLPIDAPAPTNGEVTSISTPPPQHLTNTYPQQTGLPTPSAPASVTRASTPSAGPTPGAASSLPPSAIIPPANPTGSPTRVYINQKVTPVLLEGLKWVAANE